MMKTLSWCLLLFAAFLGFYYAQPEKKKAPLSQAIYPEREFPVTTRRSFVFVIHADNDAPWCEKSLRSIFAQDYEPFRVIFVDDASSDETLEKTRSFVLENQQEHRAVLIQNEERLGKTAALYRAIGQIGDGEIVIPISAKDWLADEMVLKKLNQAYQNPDVWTTWSSHFSYPSYAVQEADLSSFYGALFKQIRLSDLYKNGKFFSDQKVWIAPLNDLAAGRKRVMPDPYLFKNEARLIAEEKIASVSVYEPLTQFPKGSSANHSVDLFLYSFDRPLQLYACLESIHRYFSGLGSVFVLYRTSQEKYDRAYEVVKASFPSVIFERQLCKLKREKKDFREKALKLLKRGKSSYILFAVDDNLVKDATDLSYCCALLEKTGAYGFFLRLGRNISYSYQISQEQPIPPSVSVAPQVYAWDFKTGWADWNFPNNLDMTIYRKEDVLKLLEKERFNTPNSMEQALSKTSIDQIGLYFEQSKILNLPLNVMGRTGNAHMNFMTAEELLVLFNQGLKMDLEPFHQVANRSPHFDQIPEFIPR